MGSYCPFLHFSPKATCFFVEAVFLPDRIQVLSVEKQVRCHTKFRESMRQLEKRKYLSVITTITAARSPMMQANSLRCGVSLIIGLVAH